MAFLLSEDNALRNMLLGMTVTDQKAASQSKPRSVGVWFGQPDLEIRDQSYPYLTIDMIDINEDRARRMEGRAKPEYLDPEFVGDDWDIAYPIPVNIDYQVTTYARQPQHDRLILAQLLGGKLPFRFGTLNVDNTVRRLDVLDVSKRDTVEQGKRLFMNSITIRVSSEITSETLRTLYKVNNIRIDGIVTGFAKPEPAFDTITITAPTVTP